MKLSEIVPTVAAFIAILLLWEAAGHYFHEYRFLFSYPSAIVHRISESPDRFYFHALTTLYEMAGGFLLALAIAFPMGWAMWSFRSARRVLQPLIVLVQCVPMFTLAPLMVLWFGWGYLAVVVPTALMIFFPLMMNIYQGFAAVPQEMLNYFNLHRATAWQLFTKLQFPWALPYIFSGFRIAGALAGIGAVAGEWAGAQSGLGVLMLESRRVTDLEATFAALVILALITFTFYGWVVWVESLCKKRRFLAHRSGQIAIALISIFLFTGCSSNETGQVKTRLLLDWFPNPNHVPLYAGIEEGYFREQGIEIELLKPHDPADAIPLLESGQVELALYYTTETLQAKTNRVQVQPVGILIGKPLNGLIYRRGEGIASIADLEGREIGYCLSTSPKRLRYLLSKNGVNPSGVRNVSFDLVGMLASKKVDALYEAYWNIECEHLRALGIETDYFELTDMGVPDHPELIVLAKEGRHEAAFLEKFAAALQKSIDYSTMHPDKAFHSYAKANPDKSKETLRWEERAWYATYSLLSDKQQIDSDAWNKFAAWLYAHDLLE